MTTRLEVKACGARGPLDAVALEAVPRDGSGAVDFLGLNLVGSSPRCIDLDTAGRIVGACRALVPVLVVRDVAAAQVERVAEALSIHWLQLHGSEPLAEVRALARRFQVIKALDPIQLADDTYVMQLVDAGVRRLLLDGSRPGSGQRWALPAVKLESGQLHGVPVWLAGGLHAGNVAAAAAALGVSGVDAATGVERFGKFAPDRAIAFAQAARGVEAPQRPALDYDPDGET